MVFTSYGGLLPGQSEEDFFSCSSMPRNRELMRVFKDLGLVEQLGSGMSRILKVYNKNIFKISEHFIKVEFPFSVPLNLLSTNNGNINGDINGNINGDISRVLLLLEKQPSITAKQMAEVLQISPRKVSRIIKELKEKEIIVRIGSNKTGYWKIQQK